MTKRMAAFDYIRGLAMVMIVWGHFSVHPDWIHKLMNSVCLACFFLSSGYFLRKPLLEALTPSRHSACPPLLGRKNLPIFAAHIFILKLMELHRPGRRFAEDLLRLAVSVEAGLADSRLPAALKGLNAYRKEKAV